MNYQAFVVSETPSGEFISEIKQKDVNELPQGDLLIKVSHSSVNFKDALSFSGNKGVTQSYPHTPGIDAAGEVIESSSKEFPVGCKVLVTGYDLGMNTSGGFGEYIRVPASWVIKRRDDLSPELAMAWGTAGLTAALCVDKLISQSNLSDKPIVVTGSSGGVGSIAIRLLVKLGFDVHGVTSKSSQVEEIKKLDASKVYLLDEFLDDSKRPMLKPEFSAAIDVAGGNVLETLLKKVDYQGAIACCGLVASPKLVTSVFPFILRDISLLGVDSVELPLQRKQAMWDKIANEWSLDNLLTECKIIRKEELSSVMTDMLAGKTSGRYILAH